LFQPEELPRGFTNLQVVLLAFDDEPDCNIVFEGNRVTAAIEGFEQVFVPGTGIAQAITLSVNVADAAPIGDRRVSLRNPNGPNGPPIGCLIQVVESASSAFVEVSNRGRLMARLDRDLRERNPSSGSFAQSPK
jgi:hypothetical protein